MSVGWSGESSNSAEKPLLLYQKICVVVWNLLQLGSIAWFILSIEYTIRWNDIRGINTIDSTGQLIPFVMGCLSTSQVM